MSVKKAEVKGRIKTMKTKVLNFEVKGNGNDTKKEGGGTSELGFERKLGSMAWS